MALESRQLSYLRADILFLIFIGKMRLEIMLENHHDLIEKVLKGVI